MTQNEFEKFCALWTAACVSTSGGIKNKPDEATLALEFGALLPLSFDVVRQAIIDIKRSLRYRITAADVWEYAQGGDAESRAIVAWSLVRDDIKRLHPRDSITGDDPVTMWAIKNCGGWYILSHMETEKAMPLFTKFYVAGVKQGIGFSDVSEHLVGEDEYKANSDHYINAYWDGSIKKLTSRTKGNPLQIGA